MSVLPPHTSTLSIAKESLAMSEKTGDRMFQRMAIAFMALTGIGTLLHAVHEIYRDVQPRSEKSKNNAGSRHEESFAHAAIFDEDIPPEETHMHRARNKPRAASDEMLWSEAVRHGDHSRRR